MLNGWLNEKSMKIVNMEKRKWRNTIQNWDSIKKGNIRIMGIQESEKRTWGKQRA